MAQQFKMAPENLYLCEIKVTVTLLLIVGQILIVHLHDHLHYLPLYTRRDLERIFTYSCHMYI